MSQAQLRIGTHLAGAHRRRLVVGETTMAKITVIKKATDKAKPQGWCPVLIDDNPMIGKK
jgi:hypothetical protein